MAELTEGIGAATESRRGAFSPQNAREGMGAWRHKREAYGHEEESRDDNIESEWGDNIESGWGQQQKRMGTTTETNGATMETDGDNNRNGWGQQRQ